MTCVGGVLDGLGLRRDGHGLEATDMVTGLFSFLFPRTVRPLSTGRRTLTEGIPPARLMLSASAG